MRPSNRPIKVMIVEDSRTVREHLEHIISSDPRLEVIASASSGEEALRKLETLTPDVISMDIRLPGMNGFETTRRIMTIKPTPIVVVSASIESEDLKVSMNALRAGALAVVEKPVGQSHADYQASAEGIRTKLVIMSEVRVIRQRFRPAVEPGGGPPSRPLELIAMVASTGGPNALTRILNQFSRDFPLPILIVQHIAASFMEGFAVWLGEVCPLPVSIAKEGEIPLAGHIYLAPAQAHLIVDRGRMQHDDSPPLCMQKPSGSLLFDSLARTYGPRALGVLLTGMGEDGASGLTAMHRAGAYTIAEDESTAVVYGMPAAAVRMGGASESLPLDLIGPRILELLPAGPRPGA